MIKKRLTAEERYGLTSFHIYEAEKHLRQFKTAGAIEKQEATPLYELFLLGYSIEELNRRFPQYSIGKIALTAAINSWVKDKERVASSIYDRIKSRIVRSTVEQVEFLTDMVSVSTVENAEEMRRYLEDPTKTPPPKMRIKNLKEYQQVIEMLANVTDSIRAMSGQDTDASSKKKLSGQIKKPKPLPSSSEESTLLAQLVEDTEGESES